MGSSVKAFLAGREPEIRQAALIKAFGGFLEQNPGYIHAWKSDDDEAVQAAMARCAAITLQYAKAQIARELSLERSRFTMLTEANGGICQHSAELAPNELTTADKAMMTMIGVRSAVREGNLSQSNAGIVSMICENSLTVGQIALLIGITPSAVSQQLRRVRKVVPRVMEWVEQPWHA